MGRLRVMEREKPEWECEGREWEGEGVWQVDSACVAVAKFQTLKRPRHTCYNPVSTFNDPIVYKR